METLTTRTIGSYVAEDYRTAAVFQKYGIDFCCRGGKTIEEVCENKGLDADQILSELTETAYVPAAAATDYQSWPADLLADYIEKKHHRYITETTPALLQYLDKLCKVHGPNHPELFEINEEFKASAAELALHMQKEEMILFPFVRQMVAAKSNPGQTAQTHFGSVENPIRVMMQEHDIEGERFRKISALSNNYTAPADGCTTYRVAYMLLKEFEEDLHLHIHLENNILFKKALGMELN